MQKQRKKQPQHHLKELLRKHRIPCYQAAAKLGISAPALSGYFSGDLPTPPSLQQNIETLMGFLEAKKTEPFFEGLILE